MCYCVLAEFFITFKKQGYCKLTHFINFSNVFAFTEILFITYWFIYNQTLIVIFTWNLYFNFTFPFVFNSLILLYYSGWNQTIFFALNKMY